MICANFSLLSLLILRWKESGHFPLSNLYESLMFLSWSFSTFHLILENVEFLPGLPSLPSASRAGGWPQDKPSFLAAAWKNPYQSVNFSRLPLPLPPPASPPKGGEGAQGADGGEAKQSLSQPKISWLTGLTSPPALFTNAFATFSLPSEMQHSSALVPALQSNWLMMHVTVMILSYSALICGSLLSIGFLIFSRNLNMDFLSKKDQSFRKLINSPTNMFQQDEFLTSSVGNTISLKNSLSTKDILIDEIQTSKNQNQMKIESQSTTVISTKQKFAEKLDNLSYRILGIGFPLLTIGILSGAVWANEAWGSYWSWDPKETWALATWFVFAIYLHTRLTKGWSGKKPAIIASLGFVTVWICFLGVNLLGEGLHSYGFFK